MLNATLGGGLTGNAQAVITANTYDAYNLVNATYPIIAAISILAFLYVLVFMPKKMQTLFIGYITFFLTGILIGITWVLFKSTGPVIKAVWIEWLTPLGKLLVEYGVYMLISIPMAYLVGLKVEKDVIPKLESGTNKT